MTFLLPDLSTPADLRPAVRLSIWLVDPTYTQQTIASDYIPLAIGNIAAFTGHLLDLAQPIRLFKYPEDLFAAAEAGPLPDIVGLSNYVWNHDLSMQLAAWFKRRNPATVVVMGGPNYPVVAHEQEAWLKARPLIDFYVIKEGEAAFANLALALERAGGELDAVKRMDLPSVHAIDADGAAHLAEPVERIRDHAAVPSPYLNGMLDGFFDGKLMPLVQTNRGCPFSCTFCVEGLKYYSKVHRSPTEKVAAELDYIGRKMVETRRPGARNDLNIADSNFGMYKEDLDTCRELARTRKLYNWPDYINVATGKNQKERVLEASRMIDGALRLSGSVQSLGPEVLKNIKRANISTDDLMTLALDAAEIGANSYSEIILGLPGDTREIHLSTLRTIMDAGFTNVFLYQLMMLPGTEMSTEESKQTHGMRLRYRVLPRCHGYYDVAGERVIAAEVEEICVATDTLSFDDYLDCRRFHLLVTIFYNDGVFGTLVKLLRMLNLSTFRWIELIGAMEVPEGLRDLFASFTSATRDELWDSREALEAFVREPGVIERYVAGELGYNLLFVHKSLAMTRHVRDLAAMARAAALELFRESGCLDDGLVSLVDDALAYHCERLDGIFEDRDEVRGLSLSWDIPRLEETARPAGVEDYRLASPIRLRLEMTAEQRELIANYRAIYGDTPVGIGRILSKVYVRRLFRKAAAAEGLARGGEI